MKFLLFRILLLHRTRDQGFTLPMVIGIGLIMVLLSSVALVQSSEENLTAISKDSSSTALAMAELGVARYRELLNNNRVLAIYSLSNWTTVADQTCDEISAGTGGWANSNDWRDITLNENDYGIDFNDDGDKIDTTVPIGSYRIVDYRFQNDNNPDDDGNVDIDGNYTDVGEDDIFNQTSDADNPNNPRGILAVQGRKINDAGLDDGGVAQIQVTIPIGVNTNDLESLDPGIWIRRDIEDHPGFDGVIEPGNLIFNDDANLVLYRDVDDYGCNTVNFAGTDSIRDPRALPPLATITGNHIDLNGNISDEPDFVDNELILGKLSETAALETDPNGVERYYYEVLGTDNLEIGAGESLLADGTAKVVVIVGGDLIIDSAPGDPTIIGNTSNSATSKHLEIHVNGDVDIRNGGNVQINALINARNGTFKISTTATVELTGSIWADNLDNANGTIDVTTDDYKFYSITTQRTPKPLTYPPTGWQQREAKDY